ncbi:hypothetical protein ACOMHN_032561 [Nucella lapillus]
MNLPCGLRYYPNVDGALFGVVHMQAVKEACGASNECDPGLICENSKCLAKIDATCNVTATECIANTDCTSKKCVCKTGYVANSAKDKCLAKLDMACAVDGNCTKNICDCNAGYVANTAKDTCLGKVETPCDKSADCIANGDCIGNKCKCKSGYEANADKNQCFDQEISVSIFSVSPVAKVGKACSDPAECIANTDCNSSKKCACKAGYTVNTAKDKCCKYYCCTGT